MSGLSLSLSKKQVRIASAILIILALALLIEGIRSTERTGDFIGYIYAGRQLFRGMDIYSSVTNTWPPFFSIPCAVLVPIDEISKNLSRGVWIFTGWLALWATFQLTTKMVLGSKFSVRYQSSRLSIQHWVVFIPVLLSFRFILENTANIQINFLMLLLATGAIWQFMKGRVLWAGGLLGLSISLKVFTIFLLLFFMLKREWKMVGWTLLFVLLSLVVTVLVWGWDQSLEYHSYWWNEIAGIPQTAHHKNQSLFGFFARLLTDHETGFDFPINLLALPAKTAQKITYAVIALAAVIPGIKMLKKWDKPDSVTAIFELTMVLAAIPILSPLAWKSYFIFLWAGYFLGFLALYHTENSLPNGLLKWLRIGFWASAALNILSTDGIVQGYLSDVLETLGAITFGTLLLLAVLFVIYLNLKKFQTDSWQLPNSA